MSILFCNLKNNEFLLKYDVEQCYYKQQYLQNLPKIAKLRITTKKPLIKKK